ncbi:unnamed protein product, partial [Penicillium discolor]
MYNPAFEKDACGLAMVATLRGEAGHDIIALALEALRNLEHRGAIGSDAGTGDGAGILTQMPDEFLRAVTGFELPPVGEYAAGLAFLPRDSSERRQQKAGIEKIARAEGLRVLGWREVPTANENLGKLADEARPAFEQLFRAGHELGAYFVSLSSRTLGYKGMVTTLQLEPFYPDLQDERFASELAVVHSRYSTNTFPSWPLAQPLRMLAHNGEINTVGGNRNWMRARQSQLESELLGDISPLLPICTDGASDSASFDEVLELLTLTGRSLPHAIMMMTTDGLVVIGSETGVLHFEPERIKRRGRLQPGKMFLVDTAQRRIVEDEEIKHDLASMHPWQEWLDAGSVRLADLPEREHIVHPPASITRRQRTFGYTEEEVRILLTPMEVVTSLKLGLGPEVNLLSWGPEHTRTVSLDFPVIDNDELAKIRHIDKALPGRSSATIRGLYHFDAGPHTLAERLTEMCAEVDQAIEDGAEFIILSDRDSNKDLVPIPSLLMAGDVREVHHVATLIGYGASAINPYLAMETVEHLVRTGYITGISPEKAVKNLIYALGKGVLKIMSKMGISTVSSYAGAQVFEAVGLSQEFIDAYFT